MNPSRAKRTKSAGSNATTSRCGDMVLFFFSFFLFFFLGDCSEIRQTSTLLREEGKSFFYRSIRVLSLANNSINGGDF